MEISDILDTAEIGAVVDESTVNRTLVVNQAAANASDNNPGTEEQPYQTITAAVEDAVGILNGGTPIRVLIHPGIYRESGIRVTQNRRDSPLLIIEGTEPEKIMVRGSENWPLSEWTAMGNNVYSHNWPHDFATYRPTKTPTASDLNGPLGWRREIVIINGRILEQRLSTDPSSLSGGYNFLIHEGECGGTFCVNPDADRIYIKPADDIDLETAEIEVGVKQGSILSITKDNFVLRNIVIENLAAPLETAGLSVTSSAGSAHDVDDNHARNNLLENVIVRRCNGDGIGFYSMSTTTVRNCKFMFNGMRGISSAYVSHCWWEDIDCSYNQWRCDMGNGYPWAGGEYKSNWCSKYNLYRRFKSWGRYRSLCLKSPDLNEWFPKTGGNNFWLDGNNFNIVLDHCDFRYSNLGAIHHEVSEGPLLVTDCKIIENRRGLWLETCRTTICQRSVFVDNYEGSLYMNLYNRVESAGLAYRGPDWNGGQEMCVKWVTFTGCTVQTDVPGSRLILCQNGPLYQFVLDNWKGDNNIWFNSTSVNTFNSQQGWGVGTTFENWRSLLSDGQEANSQWLEVEADTSTIAPVFIARQPDSPLTFPDALRKNISAEMSHAVYTLDGRKVRGAGDAALGAAVYLKVKPGLPVKRIIYKIKNPAAIF